MTTAPNRPLLVLTALVALTIALWIAPGEAGAGEEQGSLYVVAHIDPETAKTQQGAAHATVFVYDEHGAKVSSGKGKGGWLPGGTIPVEPGTYWVGIGDAEVAHNLYRYTVEAGQTTVVETGWVSVATMPTDIQPNVGCVSWYAQLRAYALVDGKKGDALIDNVERKPQAFGTLQLHPGQYAIEFHGFSTLVEVKAGQDYRLPTGYFGPTLNVEAYLIVGRDDDPRRQGLGVCTDGAMHVLAGDYFVTENMRFDDGARLEWVTNEVTVDTEGNAGYSELKSDRPSGKVKRADADDGRPITTAEVEALSQWGKKSGEFDDLEMFGDPL